MRQAREDDEQRPLIAGATGLKIDKQQRLGVDAERDAVERTSLLHRFSVVDTVYWSSAIFSREAMTVNHVCAHRYGDRKALGVYRVVATCISFVILAFLTVYEQWITKSRIYLSLAWWVSLGTLVFFALSLLSLHDYFREKVPSPKAA